MKFIEYKGSLRICPCCGEGENPQYNLRVNLFCSKICLDWSKTHVPTYPLYFESNPQ